MNILFLADNFPPERNAQASRVYERACYWQRWGHEVTVITCFPNFPEGKLYFGYRNKLREVRFIDGIRVVRTKTFIAPMPVHCCVFSTSFLICSAQCL